MTDRMKAYKNHGKVQDFQKRVRDNFIQLRREKKDEYSIKRRNLPIIADDEDHLIDEKAFEESQAIPQRFSTIEGIVEGLRSESADDILEATRAARKILSKEANAPINDFINAGLLPVFVSQLSSNSISLQFESAWVLTNIVSGDETQTAAAVKEGTDAKFLSLLNSPALNVVEQVLWGLANIVGTNADYRDLLLSQGILNLLVKLVESTSSKPLLATASWCLSNLCRRMNRPPAFETVKNAVPTLSQLLEHDCMAVVSDACWALSYFTEAGGTSIQWACDCDVVTKLVKLLTECSERSIAVPALRALGNIVTGDETQTQMVLDAGGLQALKSLIDREHTVVLKEVTWMISNIMAGNSEQIGAVMAAGFLTFLGNVLKGDDHKLKNEAAWAICNLTCAGTTTQLTDLVRSENLILILKLLRDSELRLTKAILDAVLNTLRSSVDNELIENFIEELKSTGLDSEFGLLQMHANKEIHMRATEILESFPSLDSSIDENIHDHWASG